MLIRIGKILFGILLLPFCIGFGWELASTLTEITYLPVVPYTFTGGALGYAVVHFLFRRPILTYVVGHELTHALFTLLSGGSVKAFHASEQGGHVKITKSNVLITLAPYFFPLYTFLVLGAIWAARAANAASWDPWLVLLAGGSFAFHVLLTAEFLQTDQNDIREHGAFFSYPLILLFNLIFAALLVRLLLAQDMDFTAYLAGGIIRSVSLVMFGLVNVSDLITR